MFISSLFRNNNNSNVFFNKKVVGEVWGEGIFNSYEGFLSNLRSMNIN